MDYPLILNECPELQPLIKSRGIQECVRITSANGASRISLAEQGLCAAAPPAASAAKRSDRVSMASLPPAAYRRPGAVYAGAAAKEADRLAGVVRREAQPD